MAMMLSVVVSSCVKSFVKVTTLSLVVVKSVTSGIVLLSGGMIEGVVVVEMMFSSGSVVGTITDVMISVVVISCEIGDVVVISISSTVVVSSVEEAMVVVPC